MKEKKQPKRIKKLEEWLTKQIAAGQIVERPAAVLKELLENSLDSGATFIEAYIEQSGLRLIYVRDNGHGIQKEDLLLAVSRHSTSKISTLEDLQNITSLGFRGEALGAISSVAHLEITSRVPDSEIGWSVNVSGNNHTEFFPQRESHPIGTSVLVHNIFFNIPGRRKFLKSERTEFIQLQELAKRVAMAHFHVTFRLYHNNNPVLILERGEDSYSQNRRISQVFGLSFMEQAISIDTHQNELELQGWISPPTCSTNKPNLQYLYVNGRIVHDRLVVHAIRSVYEDILFKNQHPVFLLYLKINPSLLDVNIHPSKNEIRFHNGHKVYSFVRNALHEKLASLRPRSISGKTSNQNYDIYGKEIKESPEKRDCIQLARNIDELSSTPLSPLEINTSFNFKEKKLTPVLGFAIAQLKKIYILSENLHGLVLVDMHAAHERVLYQKLKKELNDGNLVGQALLLPEKITLDESELECIKNYEIHIKRMGLRLEYSGVNTICISEVPALLKSTKSKDLVRMILSELMKYGKSTKLDLCINSIISSIACHAAVRAQHYLTIAEMNSLLRAIEATPHSSQCNHGRPTWIQIALSDLDNFFLRGK